MNIYDFLDKHAIFAFFIIYIIYIVSEMLIKIIIRFYRMVMVGLRGWPPHHLDGDGDWKKEKEED
jgi:hypothetical protein